MGQKVDEIQLFCNHFSRGQPGFRSRDVLGLGSAFFDQTVMISFPPHIRVCLPRINRHVPAHRTRKAGVSRARLLGSRNRRSQVPPVEHGMENVDSGGHLHHKVQGASSCPDSLSRSGKNL